MNQSNNEIITPFFDEENFIYIVAVEGKANTENIGKALEKFPKPLNPLNVYALAFTGSNQNTPNAIKRKEWLDNYHTSVIMLSDGNENKNSIEKAKEYMKKILQLANTIRIS